MQNHFLITFMLVTALLVQLLILILLGWKWKTINRMLTQKNKALEEANTKLTESEKKLHKVNQIRSKLYSVMAHDLRNPANAIIGFSQLLARNPSRYTEEEIQKFTTIINKSARNVYGMLENLLEWSKAQSSNMEIRPETFDLHAMVLNNFALFELTSYAKNIDLVCQVHKGTIIHTDKNLLSTILRNLIDNALKFTPDGGQIMISSFPAEDFIQIWVADTGQGMSKEKLDNLFRMNESITEKYTGSGAGHGLGLILCKDFIEMLNGDITVESQPGKGSIFKFTLPIK